MFSSHREIFYLTQILTISQILISHRTDYFFYFTQNRQSSERRTMLASVMPSRDGGRQSQITESTEIFYLLGNECV